MIELGYKLSSEEHRPNDLVRYARMAEDAGFGFAMISDHFHPWIDREGQSPFVWSVIGGISQATKRIALGTAVTCPTLRVHPAIVAQAAATAADMMEGRFRLAVGTGERLNEHVTGRRWPRAELRQAMLEEAIAIIRLLWRGERASYDGRFYTVEDARIYTLPPVPPPLYVAADAPRSARMAGRLGDGLVSTTPDESVTGSFESHGGAGKPRMVEVTVCWGPDAPSARQAARAFWPIAGMPGPLLRELALPRHFEAVASLVTEEAIAQNVACGPDPEEHVRLIQRYADAGYSHVFVHQIGPDQEGFFRFYEREILPRMAARARAA